jgi:hypothetical protein
MTRASSDVHKGFTYNKPASKLVETYTRTPVTMEAIKVPTIAKVIIAPKFEKNGFCQYGDNKFS